MADPKHMPRPTLMWRLRARLRRLSSALVWLTACAAVVWLYDRQNPGVKITGIAQPIAYSVAPASQGRLASLVVSLHDQVERGQLVATLDSATLELELRSAQAELERLAAELKREGLLQVAAGGAETNGQINRLRRFSRDREQARIDELRMIAKLEEDRILTAGALIQLDRQRTLNAKGLVAEDVLTDFDTQHKALAARVKQNDAVLAKLQEQLAAAAERHDNYRAELGELPGVADLVEPFHWAVEVQRVRLEQISLARARQSLRAPMTGTVAQILVRPGEFVAAGQPVLSIIEPETREILAILDERQHRRVQPGTLARVIRLSDGAHAETTVLRRGPQVERIPDRVTGTPELLRYGVPVYMSCPPQLEALPGEAFDVLLLPQ